MFYSEDRLNRPILTTTVDILKSRKYFLLQVMSICKECVATRIQDKRWSLVRTRLRDYSSNQARDEKTYTTETNQNLNPLHTTPEKMCQAWFSTTARKQVYTLRHTNRNAHTLSLPIWDTSPYSSVHHHMFRSPPTLPHPPAPLSKRQRVEGRSPCPHAVA